MNTDEMRAAGLLMPAGHRIGDPKLAPVASRNAPSQPNCTAQEVKAARDNQQRSREAALKGRLLFARSKDFGIKLSREELETLWVMLDS